MRASSLIVIFLLVVLSAAPASPETWKPELMDRGVELREALAAGPAAIRDGAGVYVLTDDGYELARESTNGFHCIVGRSQPEARDGRHGHHPSDGPAGRRAVGSHLTQATPGPMGQVLHHLGRLGFGDRAQVRDHRPTDVE